MILASLIYIVVVGFIVALGFLASYVYSFVAVKDRIFEQQENPIRPYHPIRRV